MRYGRLVALAALLISVPAGASAETLSDSHQVQVRAIVPPNQFIIINDAGQITEIDSNSSLMVTPKVYKNHISENMQTALTDRIYDAYLKLTTGKLHAGTVYKSDNPSQMVGLKQLDLLSI